jgi:hypothetical protein
VLQTRVVLPRAIGIGEEEANGDNVEFKNRRKCIIPMHIAKVNRDKTATCGSPYFRPRAATGLKPLAVSPRLVQESSHAEDHPASRTQP